MVATVRRVPDAPPPLATALGAVARRPRRDDDAGLLLALYASAREAELALTGWDEAQRRAFLELQLRAREQHRDATRAAVELWVVTLDDVPVGQLDLARTDGAVEVLEIALMPGLRGQGLGTALLAQVLAAADADGLATRLHVEEGNPARRLYERLGFELVGATGLHLAMERPAGGGARTAEPHVPPAPAPAADGDLAGGAELPTYEALAEHVGAAVPVLPDGPELAIAAVDARPRRAEGGRRPFSLLLEGPLDRPLDQGLHRLEMPGGSPVLLFLVPLMPTERAVYEAVFT